MKPARFIINSDYTTVRNTGYKEVSASIPNNFTVPAGSTEYVVAIASTTLNNETDCFSVYFTSSRYDYITLGYYGVTVPEGSYTTSPIDEVYFRLDINGTTATLTISCINAFPEESSNYQGYGQTITAHILTFKDPFTE